MKQAKLHFCISWSIYFQIENWKTKDSSRNNLYMFTLSVNCEINVVMTNGMALVRNWRFIYKFRTLKNKRGTNSMEQNLQLIRSFSPCRLIFVFTRVRVRNGSCLKPLECSAHLILIFIKILLVLFSHLYVGLPSDFIAKRLCEFLIFHTNGECQIRLDLTLSSP